MLVQNKVDLVSEAELGNEEEVRKFGEENGYINFFRTSAKTRYRVDECMDFLIQNIVDRLDEYLAKNLDTTLDPNRTSIVKMNQPKKDTTMLQSEGCCGV